MQPKKRRRIKQTQTLEERLVEHAKRLRERARTLPAGYQRELLLRRAGQDEVAARLTEWLRSPGLSPPE